MTKAGVFKIGESGLDAAPLEQERIFTYQIRIYDRSGNKVGEFASSIKNVRITKFNFGYLRDGGCSDFSFTLGDVSPFTIDYHYRVELCFYDQANPWYSGYVTKRPERGTAKEQTYSGYGYRKQLDGIRVNEVDTAQEVATIIGDTLDNYIVPNTDIVKDTNKIPVAIYAMISTIYWDRIPASDLFERLRQLAGAYEWGVDEERDFYFRAISTQIFENFWIGKHLDSFKGTEDPEPIRNRLYVKCGRLTDGSDYVLQVPDLATEPTASQTAYGLKEEVVTAPEFWPTFDTTDLASGVVPTTNPVAGVPANATDGNIATYWDSGAAQAIGHYIQVDLGAIFDRIARVVLDSSTTLARDEFARGFDIRISTTGAFAGEEVVVFTSTALSTTTPDIRFVPVRGRYVRITLTTTSTEPWHLGEFGVYALDTSDVARWAAYILNQKKDIRKKASLTIKKVNELIETKHVIKPFKPRGQWGIYDEDGNKIEDYPVISVKYSLSGDSFDMTAELGELERESIPAELRKQLQRMEEFNMSGVRRSDDLASGIGTSPLGITGTMIGKEEIQTPHLIANIITAALIEAGAVTAEKISILKHLVSGATWTNNNPIAGSVSWSGASVTYNGITYAIADGNTALAYIWWDFSLSTVTFQTAAAKPALADEDFIACFNNAGTHELVWNATLIEGGTIRTGTVDTDELTTLAVTTAKLDAGAVTAVKMTVADLVDIANLLTVAAGRIVIGANVLGAGLDGMLITDGGAVRRVEIGEVAAGVYSIRLRDSAGVLTVDLGELQDTWIKIYDNTLAANTTKVTIAGLDGDTDEFYKLEFHGINNFAGANGVRIRLNDDAGNNYGREYNIVQGGVNAPGANEPSTYLYGIDWTAANQVSWNETVFWTPTNYERLAITQFVGRASGTNVGRATRVGAIWSNTVANITSITFTSDNALGMKIGTTIILYKRAN